MLLFRSDAPCHFKIYIPKDITIRPEFENGFCELKRAAYPLLQRMPEAYVVSPADERLGGAAGLARASDQHYAFSIWPAIVRLAENCGEKTMPAAFVQHSLGNRIICNCLTDFRIQPFVSRERLQEEMRSVRYNYQPPTLGSHGAFEKSLDDF